jgi:hypothetical protein
MDVNNPLFQDLLKQFEEALAEKTEIDEKKKVTDEKVEALSDAVRALHKVYGGTLPEPVAKQIEGDLGITDQVREAMKSQQGAAWLQPTQVRTLVEQRGFALAGYSNPMAVIHQVLKRLEKQGQLEVHPQGQHYRWKKQNL